MLHCFNNWNSSKTRKYERFSHKCIERNSVVLPISRRVKKKTLFLFNNWNNSKTKIYERKCIRSCRVVLEISRRVTSVNEILPPSAVILCNAIFALLVFPANQCGYAGCVLLEDCHSLYCSKVIRSFEMIISK